MDSEGLAKTLVQLLTNESDYHKGVALLKMTDTDADDLWNYLDKLSPVSPLPLPLDLGTGLQRSLESSLRKKLAANYTIQEGTSLILNLAEKTTESVADPFCGSGRLIVAYLQYHSGNFPDVYLNDIYPEAALIAFYEVFKIFQERNEPLCKLHLSISDGIAWKPPQKIALILTNPPFTRVHHLQGEQLASIRLLKQSYGKYISGQPGLHIYGLYLIDSILKKGGTVISVLPTTTISSNYSNGYQRFLTENYSEIEFYIPSNVKGLSEDSDFRELVIRAKKIKGTDPIKFTKLTLDKENQIELYSNFVDRKEVEKKNWMRFFHTTETLNLVNLIESKLKSLKELDIEIRRGVEMYGPEFFFLPNKRWQVISDEGDTICIQSNSHILTIPKSNLQKILRKPSLYSGTQIPDCREYALVITPSPPEWFHSYLKVSGDDAQIAKRKFGDNWFSHIKKQFEVKNPFSQLFLADKFGIATSTAMCYYTEEPISCTKNFYFFKNLDLNDSRILAAWMSSSIYIFLFLVNRREIGGSYGRMQISDLMRTPFMIDLQDARGHSEILHEFLKMNHRHLPPIPEQLAEGRTKALDQIFLQMLGLEDIAERLYTQISLIFADISDRD